MGAKEELIAELLFKIHILEEEKKETEKKTTAMLDELQELIEQILANQCRSMEQYGVPENPTYRLK